MKRLHSFGDGWMVLGGGGGGMLEGGRVRSRGEDGGCRQEGARGS